MRLFSIVFSVALALTLIYVGCSKSGSSAGCTPTTKEEDDAKMVAYMSANGINAPVKDPSGMYYQIITEGTGNKPNVNSRVNATYVGKLTDNTTFDSGTNIQFMLNGVIPGWQIGLSKIAAGGKIKLVIPPYLAYGCKTSSAIPGNSVLYFEVDLLNVK